MGASCSTSFRFRVLHFGVSLDVFLRFSWREGQRKQRSQRGPQGALNESQPGGNSGVGALHLGPTVTDGEPQNEGECGKTEREVK